MKKERKESGMEKNWDEMTEAEKFKEVFRKKVTRSGSGVLLRVLDEIGFFDAPASTKYHGAHPGGLVKHSNNVYRRLVMLAAAEDRRMKLEKPQYSEETLAIVALLHDVCKADIYRKEDGKEVYSKNDPLPLGHGEKSVYKIMRHMFLAEEEALAIRWHMGAYDSAACADCREINKAFNQCRLAVMLHIADMMATYLDETEVAGSEKK